MLATGDTTRDPESMSMTSPNDELTPDHDQRRRTTDAMTLDQRATRTALGICAPLAVKIVCVTTDVIATMSEAIDMRGSAVIAASVTMEIGESATTMTGGTVNDTETGEMTGMALVTEGGTPVTNMIPVAVVSIVVSISMDMVLMWLLAVSVCHQAVFICHQAVSLHLSLLRLDDQRTTEMGTWQHCRSINRAHCAKKAL